MDFTLSPAVQDYRARIAAFVTDHILPVESDRASYDEHGNITQAALAPLRAKARPQGLWALQVSRDWGGQGLGKMTMAVCYEEMNRSIFGPVTFNSAAPDDGNMMMLDMLATDAQKSRWLTPIVNGDVRSAFAMTEPHPGGGSDPGMMLTRATRDGDDWVIECRKWFITGAEGAAHFTLMARSSDDPRTGLTAFQFHKDTPGWHIDRRIPIMGPEEHGGHCEMVFDWLRVPNADILMGEGRGLKVTQARLTHCMRWLGLSRRCVEIATEYASSRMGFGIRLIDRESVQMVLGKLAMDIEIGRLLVMKAAYEIDQGRYGQKEVSMAKIHVANLVHQAADTAIQLNGARGYSTDTPLEWIYRYARQARLADGADEVHKMVLSRHLAKLGRDFWRWDVADA